ncbi:hypothetical protein [Eubacterium sp. ER2]|uniref:hypothetical protein n=1 Tax=Eubacterium sp. ER2 TaxID=1519438 RepID=UPI00051AEA2F|nr:hypothetical protein [Eubacterium sp. ER2]
MKKNFKKVIAFVLCTASVISFAGPATVFASEENPIISNADSPRENLTMESQTGTIEEGNYVYTYDENGIHYKVVEETQNSLNTVTSQTYAMDQNGNYVLEKTVKSTINGNDVIVETTTPDGQTTSQTISPQQGRVMPYSDGTTGEWNTSSYDGSVYIWNFSIATIAQVLFMALGLYLAEKVPQKLYTIAEFFFSQNCEMAYYHDTYSYMLSDTNQFVIVREAISVMYFLDSAHNYYVDSYYEEFDGRGVIIS